MSGIASPPSSSEESFKGMLGDHLRWLVEGPGSVRLPYIGSSSESMMITSPWPANASGSSKYRTFFCTTRFSFFLRFEFGVCAVDFRFEFGLDVAGGMIEEVGGLGAVFTSTIGPEAPSRAACAAFLAAIALSIMDGVIRMLKSGLGDWFKNFVSASCDASVSRISIT